MPGDSAAILFHTTGWGCSQNESSLLCQSITPELFKFHFWNHLCLTEHDVYENIHALKPVVQNTKQTVISVDL